VSYTTNPTSSRLKINKGWVTNEFFTNNYKKVNSTLTWFKTFSMLKNFLKFMSWHLLAIQPITVKNAQVLLIKAHRLPKRNRKAKAVVRHNGYITQVALDTHNSLKFKKFCKKTGLIRYHFFQKRNTFKGVNKQKSLLEKNLKICKYHLGDKIKSKIFLKRFVHNYVLSTKN